MSGAAAPGSNWGRWGAADEAGAGNLLGPETVRAAAGLVREGRVLSLAQPLGPATPLPPHRRAPARFMDRDAGDYLAGARVPGGFRFAEDTVLLSTHSGTHIDALAHVWEGEELYNGHPAASVRSTRGAQRCGADKLAPVVARGVLLDLCADGELAGDAAIGAAELEAAYARGGIEPSAGDAVLLRTGWLERHRGDPEGYFAGEPGPSRAGAAWLGATDPVLVGADNYAVERQPSGEEAPFPVHVELLHRRGVPLAENLELGELAASGRAEFLFVAAPLPLVGSVGSPVAPLAVL